MRGDGRVTTMCALVAQVVLGYQREEIWKLSDPILTKSKEIDQLCLVLSGLEREYAEFHRGCLLNGETLLRTDDLRIAKQDIETKRAVLKSYRMQVSDLLLQYFRRAEHHLGRPIPSDLSSQLNGVVR